jgi:hemerythrin-like domain-containing protein
MDEAKIDQMRSTLNKLEDIKNSQESIIDKINHVITDLFEHPDKELEKIMNAAHQESSDNVDTVRDAMEEYEMRINKLENQD